jgi:hypothetical protein
VNVPAKIGLPTIRVVALYEALGSGGTSLVLTVKSGNRLNRLLHVTRQFGI